MAAKTMPGFYGQLTQVLEASDRAIPLDTTSDLLARLNEDKDFTTLLIQDTVGYEVVKAINLQGNLVIDRGLSGTTAKLFPVGSCVMFAVTDELIKAMACETDCCENGEDITFGKASPEPTSMEMETLPHTVVGGLNALLGAPDGFMLINGKRVPYYENEANDETV